MDWHYQRQQSIVDFNIADPYLKQAGLDTLSAMMQVRRRDDNDMGGLVSSLHLLWEERRWCDGLVICRDGAVPFASLALASSSPQLARTLAGQDTADTVKIIARGFR